MDFHTKCKQSRPRGRRPSHVCLGSFHLDSDLPTKLIKQEVVLTLQQAKQKKFKQPFFAPETH